MFLPFQPSQLVTTFTTNYKKHFANNAEFPIFAFSKTVDVAQLVRASVCGTEGRGFEPHHLPAFFSPLKKLRGVFCFS
jgi:hypothetical protein